jgi:hypothetical protein
MGGRTGAMSLRRRSSGFSGVLACGHGYQLQGLSDRGSETENERSFVADLAGCQKADIDQMGLIFSFTTKLNYD